MDTLAAFKELNERNLSSHPVEDSWLPVLYSLKLESIDLQYTNVSLAGREALQKAVDLQPKYAHAWNSLGLTFGKLQQPDKAQECFLRATSEEPSDPEAWNNLGFVYFGTGETTKAIDAYQHALQANPQHVLALYNLVTAYAAEKQWDLARQTCDILAQVNPAQAAQLRATFPPPAEPPAPATNPGTP